MNTFFTVENDEGERIDRYLSSEMPELSRSHIQKLIKDNLIEVKFEDFEANPSQMTRDIYSKLRIPGYDEAHDSIEAYLSKKKGYKKNAYKYDPRTVELVETHWAKPLKDWDYKLQ